MLPTTPGPLHTPPAGVAVKITVVSVKHTLGGALVKVILVSGFTVMVKVLDEPVQSAPAMLGVTVMVAVTGACVELVATKLGILPVPAATRPIVVLLFVQLKVTPTGVPVKLIAAVDAP